MSEEQDEAMREQLQPMAREMYSECQTHFNMAVGAIEAMYVILEGSWSPGTRNSDCRLVLEQVLASRKHPDAPPVPELVRLAAEFSQEPTVEKKSALLEYMTREIVRMAELRVAAQAERERYVDKAVGVALGNGEPPAEV